MPGQRHRGLVDAAEAPSLLETLGTRGLTQVALLAAALAWVYWQQLQRMVYYWYNNPDWSHGFLIPIFCLYFLHSRRAELAKTPVRPSWLGLIALAGAMYAYLYFIRAKIGYPQSLSIVMAIASLVLLCCGWQMLWRTAFVIGFLLLALPPPEYKYRELTQPLQQIAAFVGSRVLQLLPDVVIQQDGINVTFDNLRAGTNGSFTVAGACSGMRSLMAFVALGLAMAFFSRRPMWHRIFIAVVVVPVALFCNIVRVVVTGALYVYGHADWAKGTAHSMLGIGTFALGFTIYFGILYVLDHLFVDASEVDAGGAA